MGGEMPLRLMRFRKVGAKMYHILLGILLAIFGLFLFKCPDIFYELTESWRNDRPSGPSDAYIRHTRFGGVMCMLVGIGCDIILLFFC